MIQALQKEHNDTQYKWEKVFEGQRYLLNIVKSNIEIFSLELEKPPAFVQTGCLEIARREFFDFEAAELLMDHCVANNRSKISEIVERCFYEVVEDPLLGHFLSCIQSYGNSMTKQECIDWLQSRVSNIGQGTAAHLILSMEVGKC